MTGVMGETAEILLGDSAKSRVKWGALNKSVIATIMLQKQIIPKFSSLKL